MAHQAKCLLGKFGDLCSVWNPCKGGRREPTLQCSLIASCTPWLICPHNLSNTHTHTIVIVTTTTITNFEKKQQAFRVSKEMIWCKVLWVQIWLVKEVRAFLVSWYMDGNFLLVIPALLFQPRLFDKHLLCMGYFLLWSYLVPLSSKPVSPGASGKKR